MSTSTTTVRVTVQTRDRLAAQARERGMSISALLAELAGRAEREAMFSAEREATLAESADRAIRDEDRDWALVNDDGID